MKSINMFFLKMLVSFFGVGFVKTAPGTMGSLATIPLIFLFGIITKNYNFNPIVFFSVAILVIFIIGWISSYFYMKAINNNNDPQEIVIDEVVGQLLSFILSFSFLLFIKDIASVNLVKNVYFLIFAYIVMPFLLFRFFDISKVLLTGFIDRNMKNALGVMLDDVIAGIYAGLLNSVFIYTLIRIFK